MFIVYLWILIETIITVNLIYPLIYSTTSMTTQPILITVYCLLTCLITILWISTKTIDTEDPFIVS